MIGWKGFFDVKANAENEAIIGSIEHLPSVITSALVLVLHVGLFMGLAMFAFRKKDILS